MKWFLGGKKFIFYSTELNDFLECFYWPFLYCLTDDKDWILKGKMMFEISLQDWILAI